jgi:glycosyltransferase involved in cell wall biosynthesis
MRLLMRHAPQLRTTRPHRDVIMLCQLPPPVHGVTIVNHQVIDTLSRQGDTDIVHLPVGSAGTVVDIGRPRLAKFIDLGGTLIALLLRRLRKGVAAAAYLSFSPTGSASLRDALVAAMSRMAAKRVLVHVHGEGFGELTLGRSLRARFVRAMIGNCEIIAITQGTADVAARSALFHRVWRVPNGIADPGPVPERSRDDLLRIAYMANMQPGKGIDLLLGALRRLADAAIAFRAHLIGDGTALLALSEVRRRIEDLCLAGHVTVHGPLYGAEKYRVLARSHLFVYPSRHDHAPLVLLEAIALGLVPIVLDSGGIAEIVGQELADNVLAGEGPDDRLELLLMQRMALYDTLRDLLSEHAGIARRRYLAQYTAEHFSARLMDVFSGEPKAAAALSRA